MNNIKTNQKNDLIMFIHTFYNGTIITNTREVIPPYELDIYLPEKNIAFEYNDSELKVPIGYHDMKVEMCKASNIKLCHIWDDDWMDNNTRLDVEYMIKRLIFSKNF